MKTADLIIAVNTVWVVVAAVLVMFMQAGFAFLEAGLTRMKNAAHIAGKNVLIFGVCSIVYWAVGFGIAFGDGNSLIGTSGFFPSTDEFLSIVQTVGTTFFATWVDVPNRNPGDDDAPAACIRTTGSRTPGDRCRCDPLSSWRCPCSRRCRCRRDS